MVKTAKHSSQLHKGISPYIYTRNIRLKYTYYGAKIQGLFIPLLYWPSQEQGMPWDPAALRYAMDMGGYWRPWITGANGLV